MDINKIKETAKTNAFSGVVYVEEKEEVILEAYNGYANRTEKLLNNMETKFAIASGTKFFTALGIMKLVEANKIALDDKAFTYVDYDFPVYDKSVTIKQLLTHTSGIPDYYDEDIIQEEGLPRLKKAWYELKKPSDYLEVMPQVKMLAKPGEVFKYNNSAFVLLAVIIEKLSGDYYHWLKSQIFDQADMKDTDFYRFDQLPKNTANGYIELEDCKYRTNIYDLPIRGGGDGGLYTTAYDMIKLWKAFKSGKIVSKASVKKMLYPHYHDENTFYGLGVWLKLIDNDYYPVIVGEDPGVSFISGIIKEKLYVIISNTQDGAWLLTDFID